MRYRELLCEYRRDITTSNFGDAIIRRLGTVPVGRLHHALQGYAQLLRYLDNPSMYTAAEFRISTPSGHYIVEPDRARALADQLLADMKADTLSVIEENDPTPNKEYTVWLLRRWLTDPDSDYTRMEDYNRNDVLRAHYVGKRRGLIRPEHRDINRFRSYREFERTMLQNYDMDTLLNVEASTAQEDRGVYDEVYEDDTVRVIVPRDVKAACFWGRGTTWCTAATRGQNYFETYSKDGSLYILLPKKRIRVGEKYQIHLPSGQFMDEEDEPVDVTNLAQNVFPGFFKWLLENEPAARELIVFTDDETLTGIWQAVYAIAAKLLKQEAVELGYDDDSYLETLQNAGAVDVDGSMDEERVDRLNLWYWQVNRDVSRDLDKLRGVAQATPNQIRRWADEAALNIDGEFSTVPYLANTFRYVLYETQTIETSDVLDDEVFNYIFIYDKSSYAEKKRSRHTGQKMEIMRHIGPYYVGYLTKPDYQSEV